MAIAVRAHCNPLDILEVSIYELQLNRHVWLDEMITCDTIHVQFNMCSTLMAQ